MLDDKYISLYTHEAETARLERIIKRLWILAIIIFAALIITNGAWIYYESQWEVAEETTTTEEVDQKINADNGSKAYIAGIGDVTHGGEGSADSEADNDYTALSQKEEEIND